MCRRSFTFRSRRHALALAVTYTDNRALDAASLDSSDVRLAGPDGEPMAVTLLGVAPGAGGSTVATYGTARPTAPGAAPTAASTRWCSKPAR